MKLHNFCEWCYGLFMRKKAGRTTTTTISEIKIIATVTKDVSVAIFNLKGDDNSVRSHIMFTFFEI